MARVISIRQLCEGERRTRLERPTEDIKGKRVVKEMSEHENNFLCCYQEMVCTFRQYCNCVKLEDKTDTLTHTMQLYSKASAMLCSIGRTIAVLESSKWNASSHAKALTNELYDMFWLHYTSDECSENETMTILDMMHSVKHSIDDSIINGSVGS
jgi:hypothetical protein